MLQFLRGIAFKTMIQCDLKLYLPLPSSYDWW